MKPAGVVFARRHVQEDFVPVGAFVTDIKDSWVARWTSGPEVVPAREYVTGYLMDAERRVREKAVDWPEAVARIVRTSVVGYLVWIEPLALDDDFGLAALFEHYVRDLAYLTPRSGVQPLDVSLPFG